MRPLLLLLPLVLLAGCSKYGSLREAGSACSKWAEQGGTYTWAVGPELARYVREQWQEKPVRRCTIESETRQVLGLVGPYAKGETVTRESWDEGEGKIKARFRF